MRKGLRLRVVAVAGLALLGLVAAGPPAAAQAGSRDSQGGMMLRRFLTLAGGLGVETRDVTESDLKTDKLGSLTGAYVSRVTGDGPADKAGIKAGDVIVEFDGETVRSARTLSRLVSETPPRKTVRIGVVREGKRLDLQATLGESDGTMRFEFPAEPSWPGFEVRPPLYLYPDRPQLPRENPRFAPPWRFERQGEMGIGLQDLTPQLRDYFAVKQGVLVSSVTGNSAAARAGVRAGDIVTSVNGETVRSSDDIRNLLADKRAGDVVTLGIIRDKRSVTIKVTLQSPRYEIRPIGDR